MEFRTHGSTQTNDTQLPLILVDDDQTILRAHRVTLETNGWDNVMTFFRSEDALSYFQQQTGSLLILDVRMPGMSGYDLAKYVRGTHPEIPIIIISGVSDVQIAIEFMKLGCFDYLVKPVEPRRFLTTVQRALEFRDLKNALQIVGGTNQQLHRVLNEDSSEPLSDIPGPLGFVTRNQSTLQAYQYAQTLAGGWEPILLRGETGTGKDITAKAIHISSGRPGEFIPVNISGLDDALFSDTLFGHARGAYTHAEGKREGLIAKAKKGTLFLDEIGDLDQKNQIKLLRLLENREYYSLGSDTPQVCEARILMATHRNLEEMVDSGQFRKDLYYRISTFQVHLPSLRNRKEDVPYLAQHFLEQATQEKMEIQKPIPTDKLIGSQNKPTITDEVLNRFYTYDFPGNIRELRSIIYRAYTQAHAMGRTTIELKDLIDLSQGTLSGLNSTTSNPEQNQQTHQTNQTNQKNQTSGLDSQGSTNHLDGSVSNILSSLPMLPTLDQMDRSLIEEALKRSAGNRSLAARYLGITPQALHQRLKRQESGLTSS